MLAAALLALEPMFAFFARTAYLDVPMIFFALCAYAVYFSRVRLGPIDECTLAGALLALSALSKETGVVFLVPLLMYHLAFRDGRWGSKTREAVAIVLGSAVVFVVGLQLYDTFAVTPFPTFVDQLRYIFAFSNSMTCKGLCSYPPTPLDWFFFFTKSYWLGGFSNNVFLLWLVLAWIPFGCFTLWRSRRERLTPESRLFVFSLLLFASTLLENELIYLDRGILVWYYLTLVPSLAFGGAYLLTCQQVPLQTPGQVPAVLDAPHQIGAEGSRPHPRAFMCPAVTASTVTSPSLRPPASTPTQVWVFLCVSTPITTTSASIRSPPQRATYKRADTRRRHPSPEARQRHYQL